MEHFIVLYEPSANYQLNLPLDGQEKWNEHRDFMNSLEKRGTIILGGPTVGGWHRILVVKGGSEASILKTLSRDVWIEEELLRIVSVAPWELYVDSRNFTDRKTGADIEKYFLVERHFGHKWNHSLPIRSQSEWESHAAFMDSLASNGLILLGGPIKNSSKVLLIVRGMEMLDVLKNLSEDPWKATGLIEEIAIVQWEVMLNGILS